MNPSTAGQTAPAPAWRQYTFFDVVPVKDFNDLGSSPEIFKITPEISTIVSSNSGVLVADIHGSIHILTPNFEGLKSWIAYPGGRANHLVARDRFLVTIGEEDALSSPYAPILKVWALGKKDKKTGSPLLLRSVKVKSGGRPHPISTVALSTSLSHFAIGFTDGTVLLYRNFEQSIMGSNSLTALPKPKAVPESPTEPITGLGFRESTPEEQTQGTHLFIVTTTQVLAYHVSGKGSGGPLVVIDEVGCGLGCARMDRRGKDMLVCREEAIYLCGIDGRGACYAYEGHKSSVLTYMNYIVIVSPPLTPSASAPSATVRNYTVRAGSSAASDITKVTVFDVDNKIVAYSGTVEEGVKEVFEGWGDLYVLGTDGTLRRLEEKPTSEKLDILFEKKLYLLAIGLAQSQNSDEATVADIHRRYGDHLYSKSDFGGAMQEYIKTLGYLQPSYVIRKYLDAQRIQNLTTYLQELHTQGRANSDHTTLLLNTYTKLKDNARLDSFIKSEAHRPRVDDTDDGQPPFDLDTVIRVCRQAGYFDHAAYLARKYERHEDYLRIIVEDRADYAEALAYFRSSGTETATASLARYGKAMLANLPDETTQLLIELCTVTMSTAPLAREASISSTTKTTGGASYLSYLALTNRTAQASTSSDVPPQTNGTIHEDRSKRGSEIRASEAEDSRPSTPTPVPKLRRSSEKLPSPRIFFAHFLDHYAHFVTFLEEVAEKRWEQTLTSTSSIKFDDIEVAEQKAVWNTLLELYLSEASPSETSGTAQTDKALLLLKSEALPYDRTHAIILCSIRSFIPGQILIWEGLGMHEDILRFWMDKDKSKIGETGDPDATNQVLRYLDLYGPERPHLYRLVLIYLTSNSALLSRHGKDVVRVLEYIEKEKVMTPIDVVKVLSRNNVASVGLVQQWLMARIKESKEELNTNRTLIESYRAETNEKLKQVKALSDPNNPRIFQVTRCSACGVQLDLPAVHFMCNHSYHQRCLNEAESECPNCARSTGVIAEIRRNNARLANQHELFVNEVKERGFEAIAAAFGRGWMGTKIPER